MADNFVGEFIAILDFTRSNMEWLKEQYSKVTTQDERNTIIEAIADISESVADMVYVRYGTKDDGR